MRFEAKGAWRDNALRFEALSWISGRDTCTFQVRGDMDKEGRLLLHFPADLCGEKSLPFTRALHRPEAAARSIASAPRSLRPEHHFSVLSTFCIATISGTTPASSDTDA